MQVDIEGHEYPALKGIEDKHWPMIQRCVRACGMWFGMG